MRTLIFRTIMFICTIWYIISGVKGRFLEWLAAKPLEVYIVEGHTITHSFIVQIEKITSASIRPKHLWDKRHSRTR